ncbi:NCS2 family permease [Nocardioides sp. dk4132]|uniref:NCS2 family permease n=1 Tax=Nocardioides TaxID=1839 RepID=UPI0012960DDE|nr:MULTISPECIES: NCS2 family permease [Nocardioides]MQW74656.1 NCS2 family permease [Nocardioides sp. dk4132]QGA06567.1 NCS2 family permease [Nocardioides sp. dk884]
MTSALDTYFKISERGSSIGREIRGGAVTFLTMSYILVLNPIILGYIQDSEGNYLGGGSEPNLPAIAAGTALVAGVLTMLMGAVSNFPLALAAGLGLNAFVGVAIATQSTWADAMGLVVLEGIIILLLVLTGFRRAVFHAVPAELKVAISVGIGLFIALIGFVDAGFVTRIPDAAQTSVPVQLGNGGTLSGWPVLLFGLGVLLLIALWVRKVRGAILIAIVVLTAAAFVMEAVFGGGENDLGWAVGIPAVPDKFFGVPDLSTFGEFSLFGAFSSIGVLAAALLVFSLLLADFFDTMGTMTAIGAEAGLNDAEGIPPHSQRILIVDSVAAIAGGAGGVSSNTSYVESASGVGEGARTGMASVVTGLLFLLATFFTPVVQAIPAEAAVPALVLVGFLMMQQVTGIEWNDVEIAIPAFLTVVLMPFTYSISVGIGAGFLSYVLIKVVVGKARQVRPLLWIIAALFGIYFGIEPITAWLT